MAREAIIRRAGVPLAGGPAANADSRPLAPRMLHDGLLSARGEPPARRSVRRQKRHWLFSQEDLGRQRLKGRAASPDVAIGGSLTQIDNN